MFLKHLHAKYDGFLPTYCTVYWDVPFNFNPQCRRPCSAKKMEKNPILLYFSWKMSESVSNYADPIQLRVLELYTSFLSFPSL